MEQYTVTGMYGPDLMCRNGERLMNIVKIIVSFLIRHGRNAWQLKKFSDRLRVRDFVL